MVTTLAPQFVQLHQRIGIETKTAVEAHGEVRAKLHSDPKLQEWDVDTVLIGSYKRKTSIYPCHDVDVFVKLRKCPAGTTPEAVFSEVERVLKAAYGSRATEQRRSMKVDGFPEDLSVDAVPAVPDRSRWKIPQTSGAKVGTRLIKDSWERTDPERLTDLTNDRQAKSPVIDGEPSYRRSVRMIRQIRETHLGEAHPGGLYFELLTYWAFPSVTATSSYSELVTELLERIAASLASDLPVLDPALETPYEPRPTAVERSTAATLFAGLAKTARAALSKDECPAALDWQRIFGKNSRYLVSVFPLPPNCAADGTRIQPLPRSDRGSNVDRPFA